MHGKEIWASESDYRKQNNYGVHTIIHTYDSVLIIYYDMDVSAIEPVTKKLSAREKLS